MSSLSPKKKTSKQGTDFTKSNLLPQNVSQFQIPTPKNKTLISLEDIYYQEIVKLKQELEQTKGMKELIEELENENLRLNKNEKKLNKKINEMEKSELEKNKKIEELKKDVQLLDEKLNELEILKTGEISTLEEKINLINQENTTTQKNLQSELFKMQNLIKSKEQNINDLKNKNQILDKNLADLGQEKLQQVSNLKKIQDEERKNYQSLLAELQNQQKITGDMKKSLEQKEGQIAFLENDLKKIENQNRVLKQDHDALLKEKELQAQKTIKTQFKNLSNTDSNQTMNFKDFTDLQKQTAQYLNLVSSDAEEKSKQILSGIYQQMMTPNPSKIAFGKDSNEFTLFILDHYFKYLDVNMVLMKSGMNAETEAMLTYMLSVSDFQKKTTTVEFDKNEMSKICCNDANCDDCKQKFSDAFGDEMSQILSTPKENIHINEIKNQNDKIIVAFFLNNQIDLSVEQKKKLSEVKNMKGILSNIKMIEVQPLFSKFQITYNMLDINGNRDFTKWDKVQERRGKMDYFFPIGTRRIGLNVSKKYDGGNDVWLGMENKEGEWAVAFHGTAKEDAVQNIAKDQMYRPGPRQLYENELDARTGQKCGRGIYCALKYGIVKDEYSKGGFGVNTSNGTENYRIAFQNRFNPKNVRVPKSKPEYYILNDPKDIRPYGILLEKV